MASGIIEAAIIGITKAKEYILTDESGKLWTSIVVYVARTDKKKMLRRGIVSSS